MANRNMMRFVLLAVVGAWLVSVPAFTVGQQKKQAAATQSRPPAMKGNPPKGTPAKTNAPPAKSPPATSSAAGKAPTPTTRLPTQAEKTKIVVSQVKPDLRDAALQSAAKIDKLVEKQLAKAGQESNPPASDEQFVRRAFLDITGTIPTSKQTDLFLNFKGEGRRVLLVDSLLNRPGYVSHMYNWLADTLRLVDRVDNNTYLRPYSDWVKKSLRENRPWDEMVHAMLAASGKVSESPAAGFLMRDQGMPLDNLNNAVRIFLGTRIGCAQCHDHPFDRWTQKEFYQLAAFTAGLDYQLPPAERSKVRAQDVDAAAAKPQSPEASTARQMLTASRRAITDNPKKQLKFPHDYAYDNAKPNEVATPAVLWGSVPKTASAADRRQVFAQWVTSKNNDRFARTMANRLWQKAMGVGLIEPLDDMKDDTVASNPELMEFLSTELKRLNFDLKEFQRILFYTKTYQRKVTYDDLDPSKPYLFPGPVLRRMTAEQVWDSLLTLTLENPDEILRPEDDAYLAAFDIDKTMTAAQIVERARKVIDLRKEEREDRQKRSYKGSELVRASELPQPLPEGHFLRQFGQSDRNSIADSHTDGTVPQLLTMFNGPVTHMMLEKGSVIYNEVTVEKKVDDQIERIFLCLLSRRPTAADKAAAQKEMKAAGAAGYGNVIWALLNTREFLFIQ